MRPGAGRRVAAWTAKRCAGLLARLAASDAPRPAALELVAAAPKASSSAPDQPALHIYAARGNGHRDGAQLLRRHSRSGQGLGDGGGRRDQVRRLLGRLDWRSAGEEDVLSAEGDSRRVDARPIRRHPPLMGGSKDVSWRRPRREAWSRRYIQYTADATPR